MVNAISSFSLHWGDILVLVAYFAIVIGFGIWVYLFLLLRLENKEFIFFCSHHAKIVAVLVSIQLIFLDLYSS